MKTLQKTPHNLTESSKMPLYKGETGGEGFTNNLTLTSPEPHFLSHRDEKENFKYPFTNAKKSYILYKTKGNDREETEFPPKESAAHRLKGGAGTESGCAPASRRGDRRAARMRGGARVAFPVFRVKDRERLCAPSTSDKSKWDRGEHSRL